MSDAKRKYHRLKLRLRRNVRKQKRQVEDITEQADDSLDKLVFRRIDRLKNVRRFVITWVLLLLLIGIGSVWQVRGLDKFYLDAVPSNGGIYREGLLGNFTTASPLFATGVADESVSELVFSGLFKISPDGTLEPDLANEYKTDDSGKVYTVELNNNVYWHDGEKFTADDVVYTYKTIKNPNTKSPLLTSWRDVKVEAKDEYTVVFTLPNVLSSFHLSMTNGIVPEHLLKTIDPENLRSSQFNNVVVVGTGPFKYRSVEVIGTDIDDRQEKVTLVKNEGYHNPNALIDGIVIRTYRNEETMLDAYERGEISSMVGLQNTFGPLTEDGTTVAYSTPMRSAVMIFFNNSSDNLSDSKLRLALTHGTDTDELRQRVNYQLKEVDSPFLKTHFAYDAERKQKGYNKAEAEKLLDELGWVKGEDGKRSKDGKQLKLRIISQSLTEYATIIQGIQSQWGDLGITVDALLQPEEDIQSGAIARHEYEILLYGISIGPDPDVYAFWHSSQSDPRLRSRLNLSEYNNESADEALEAGRTRLDPELRTIKYQPFLDNWKNDAPAIALYQPRFLFVARSVITGYMSGQYDDPSDRFYSITDWQVRLEKEIRQN